jgi:biotin carboxylase
MARAVRYQGLGTFEFLVDAASTGLPFVFIEANPRLQVEHTVTEEVFGVDLVQAQIRLAAGERLRAIGLDPPRRRARRAAPSSGASTPRRWTRKARHARQRPLARFDVPAGPGIRVDTHGVAGRAPSPHYDTLLAKLVVHARGGLADALRRSRRALAEFRIEGLATNLPLLRRWPRGPRWPASSCTRAGWRRRCPSCWMLPNQ